jgi:dihydrofolate reductase
MSKLTFSLNITIDGYADHTSVIADDELHDFYTEWLDSIDTVLFGRVTYQLFEDYWPYANEDPSATQSMKKFADKINRINKVVFSRTLDKANWENTRIVKDNIDEEVSRLKQKPGKDLALGGISTIQYFLSKGMVDEFWLVVHPFILGKGKYLYKGLTDMIILQLKDWKSFSSGVVALHYMINKYTS